MNDLAMPEQDELAAQLAQAQERLEALVRDLRGVDGELEGLSAERQRYQLLQEACDALDQLSELGASGLFWEGQLEPAEGDEYVRRLRQRMAGFWEQLGAIESRRQALVRHIKTEQDEIEVLEEELFEAQEEEERRRLEWIVEREIDRLPARHQLMPWSRGGQDDRRFRKSLGIALLVSLMLGLLLPLVDLPVPDQWEVIEVPERLARLVKEERPPPPPTIIEERVPDQAPPPEPEPEPEPVDEIVTPTDQPVLAEKPAPKTAPQKAQEPRAASKGILAFRDKLSNLASNKPAPKLGADARISNGGEAKTGRPERSMVTTQAPGSSGGINLASLSRDTGGGGGGGEIAGVQLTRASSSIGAAGGGGVDRPLSNGAGAGRTDEEIQIVFDRHKAALYRMYNRELRKNPTLQGQMVLRLRIEPDGSVSMCEVDSTDMNAPALSQQVTARVRTFDFGAKDVPAITILYPIDFLPAG